MVWDTIFIELREVKNNFEVHWDEIRIKRRDLEFYIRKGTQILAENL